MHYLPFVWKYYFVGQPIIYPRNDLSYAENFLYMMFAVPTERYVINKVQVHTVPLFSLSFRSFLSRFFLSLVLLLPLFLCTLLPFFFCAVFFLLCVPLSEASECVHGPLDLVWGCTV